MQLAQGCGG
jgi:hypothetical protein